LDERETETETERHRERQRDRHRERERKEQEEEEEEGQWKRTKKQVRRSDGPTEYSFQVYVFWSLSLLARGVCFDVGGGEDTWLNERIVGKKGGRGRIVACTVVHPPHNWGGLDEKGGER
jgi:hypothetical protein